MYVSAYSLLMSLAYQDKNIDGAIPQWSVSTNPCWKKSQYEMEVDSVMTSKPIGNFTMPWPLARKIHAGGIYIRMLCCHVLIQYRLQTNKISFPYAELLINLKATSAIWAYLFILREPLALVLSWGDQN